MFRFVINGVEIRVVINHIVYAEKHGNEWTLHLTNFDEITINENDVGYELIERCFDTMTITGVVSQLDPIAQGITRLKSH